jgi:uncharacterized protein (DUF305 family)
MRAPDDQPFEADPVDPEASPPRSNRWGWIGIAAAVGFLLGAIGYLVGVKVTESPDQLSATDLGFLQDMIDHHDQAVELSLLELANGSDETARHFAQETIIFQRREIGIMETYLANGGAGLGDPDRDVMTWMNMASPLAEMPGMASAEQMDELEAARGEEADRLFLDLMREHHRGGIHMAEWAAEFGSNERVKDLAGRIAEYQRTEVSEYTRLMQKLGFV